MQCPFPEIMPKGKGKQLEGILKHRLYILLGKMMTIFYVQDIIGCGKLKFCGISGH